MKKSKILLPLALVGMIFGIAACNPAEQSQENQSQAGQESQPAEESKPAESESAKQEKITITAEGDKTKLILGETVQLTASVEGVTWESKNPEVASVSESGLVTSLKEGSTSITASKDGYKAGAITIKVELEKITVTAAEDKTSLLAGQTVQLTASQDGVTWESSDETIATVNNGLVTAIKFGDVTIKASKDGYKEGTIVIHVVRPEVSGSFDLTVAADHYSADGWWELPAAGGFGFAMQTVTGWNPISQAASWGQQSEEPVETFIGGFGIGDKETVKFTATSAGKAELVLNIGNSDEVALGTVMSAKLNNVAIDLSEVALAAHAGDWGNSLEFEDLSLGELDLVQGENIVEFEFLVETNIFLNQLDVYAGSTITLVEPAAKEQITVTAATLEVIETETVAIETAIEGVSYVSVDPEVATVDENGVVTGVKMGKVDITVKKEGMYSVRVEITVNPKPVDGQILLEAESAIELEGIEPGGFSQGTPTINQDGGQWGGNAVHSGGAYVSMWGGDSLTLSFKFEATEAGPMALSVVGNAPASWGGEASPLVFKDSATVTFNDVALEFTDQEFPAASGMNPEMVEVYLGVVNVVVGENTLVVTFSGSIPSLDVFKLSVLH